MMNIGDIVEITKLNMKTKVVNIRYEVWDDKIGDEDVFRRN